MNTSAIPKFMSEWVNQSGRRYAFICIANKNAARVDEYPLTVVYKDQDENVWALPLSRWHESMTEIKE